MHKSGISTHMHATHFLPHPTLYSEPTPPEGLLSVTGKQNVKQKPIQVARDTRNNPRPFTHTTPNTGQSKGEASLLGIQGPTLQMAGA